MADPTGASWAEHRRESVFETPYFSIERRRVQPPGGELLDYFVHEAPDSAMCVCINDRDEVLLEWQYRPAIRRVSVDYPAGRIEASDADPAAAMLRELEEETGYRADSVHSLGAIDKDPGLSAARMHLFVVRGLTLGTERPDETEQITTRFVPRDEVLAMIDRSELSCAFCVSATFRAFRAIGWLASTPG